MSSKSKQSSSTTYNTRTYDLSGNRGIAALGDVYTSDEGAIDAGVEIAEIGGEIAGGGLTLAGGALELADRTFDTGVLAIRQNAEDAFDVVEQSTGEVLELGRDQFEGAVAAVDRAGMRTVEAVDRAGERSTEFGGAVLTAVLQDLRDAREVGSRRLASTEQALSAQSQRVTDIAATRLTGGVTDVVKYLSAAAAVAVIGFAIARG